MYEFGIVIGRFQPAHLAHLTLIRYGLQSAETLIIVLGSAMTARSIKNPWSVAERQAMIESCLSDDEKKRVRFVHANDYLYNDNLWITNIQQKVDEITQGSDSVALIGHNKDKTTFYLNLFPQWTFIGSGQDCNQHNHIDGTRIRNLYFKCDLIGIRNMLPEPVFEKLKSDMMTSGGIRPNDDFMELKDEYEHIVNYKEMWKGAPFPPTFVTVDAVVIKSGHVLLVRRKGLPGRGLIALPGGFLSQGESLVKGAIRELKEETGITISPWELESKIVDHKEFDHPDRSLRGRTITHAYCINLGHGQLPRVKGGDDAAKAFWIPLNEVNSRMNEFFEDHAHIITFFSQKW